VTVTATGPPCTILATASAPSSATVGTAIAFTASAAPTNCSGAVSYDWDFGDGSHAFTPNASHAYASAATFGWTMTASADGVTDIENGSVTVSATPTPTQAPTITRVRSVNSPFAIEITGTNFQSGVKVFLGTDSAAWSPTQRVSSTRLRLTGDGLSAKFPLRTAVAIKVVNPDGKSASTTFARRR
jgi:PKD repeat protein